jgi:hypothetical protein
MAMGLRRRMCAAGFVLFAAVMGTACDGGPPAERAEASVQGSGQAAGVSRAPAVDTIRARLSAASHAEIQLRAGASARVVVLFIREQDVFTCEDLGRQTRELRNWAAEVDLPFLVWAAAEATEAETRIPVFLRREHISAPAVFLTRSSLRVEQGRAMRSPAAMVEDVATSEVHGFAHPERAANVRQRSFAQELRDIYRS